MIHVFYSDLSEENHNDLFNEFLPKFPTDYQEKVKKYKRWQDAQSSLLGRILLFKGIEEIGRLHNYDIEIGYTEYNKPYFRDSSIKFNISHSGEMVVCALTSTAEIGVDIEMITPIDIDDFKTQMTENEWNRIILSNDKNDAFFNYWTQKEAVIKAHGHGMSLPLKSFEISGHSTKINEEKFFLKEINIHEKYKCYISVNRSIEEITVKKI